MSFVYTKAITKILTSGLTGLDLRMMLVMTNTTADTEEDTEFIAGFTTLDEMDGASYARQALANEAINEDLANDRAEADADNPTFATLGAGTRDVAGAIVYVHATTDADSWPLGYIDDIFPFTANGGDLTVNLNAEGWLQLANAAP